ncbi:MAG: hypothetical protein L6R41_004295 [Letrouitia leprolyta]|nr:MAG: hypothetical protein L6R41_004295 [Letrouitia leprolyta]
MDIDPVTESLGIADSVTTNNHSASQWKSLTTQAILSQKSSNQPVGTQEEQRKFLRKPKKPKKPKQSHHHHQLVPSKKTRPAKPYSKIDKSVRNGTLPKDASSIIVQRTRGGRIKKVQRRVITRAVTRAARLNAGGVAEERALERAIGSLNLDVTEGTPNREQSCPPPVLLSPNDDHLTLGSIASQYSATLTNPILRQSSVLTDKKKAIDARTARDVAAYKKNPDTVLSRRRQTRVMDALFHGRADLYAMRLEKHCREIEEVAKYLNELPDTCDVYRPQQEARSQASTEKRDLYRPQQDSDKMQLPIGKRDLYQPERNLSHVTLPLSIAEVCTTDSRDPRGIGSAPLLDSYRPAQDTRTRNRRLDRRDRRLESPTRNGDSYRPNRGNINRPLSFSYKTPEFSSGAEPGRTTDSYRPNKMSRRRSGRGRVSGGERSEEGAARCTKMIDSYRPADDEMDMQL